MGCDNRIFDPSDLPLPGSPGDDDHPAVKELREHAFWSEGMVWCSPERHGSMTGIMKTATDIAMVQKFGGGTGVPLSNLRQKGAHISTTHGKACGPVAVLKHLSSVSTMITQGGKRDGANMAVMSVHHPDIEEFIDCKAQEGDTEVWHDAEQ